MVEYRRGLDCIDWTQLCHLYTETGLVGDRGPRGDCAAIELAFRSSYRVVTAWVGQRLVGAGRLLSDGVCYATVFDVGVLPDIRRQGIATGIVQVLLEGTDGISVFLTSAFGIEQLYKNLGFRRHRNAFARYPHESDYLTD